MPKNSEKPDMFFRVMKGEIDHVVDQQGLKKNEKEDFSQSSSMRKREENPVVDPRQPFARQYP